MAHVLFKHLKVLDGYLAIKELGLHLSQGLPNLKNIVMGLISVLHLHSRNVFQRLFCKLVLPKDVNQYFMMIEMWGQIFD